MRWGCKTLRVHENEMKIQLVPFCRCGYQRKCEENAL